MVILVLNCGSSSIKYQVIDMEDASSKLLAKGIVERIGLPEGDLTHKPVGKEPFELHQPIPDHTTGIKLVLDALTDPAHGVIASLDGRRRGGDRPHCRQVDGIGRPEAVRSCREGDRVPA